MVILRSKGRTWALSRPRGRWTSQGEEFGVISVSLSRGPAKALHLCQTLPFLLHLNPFLWCRPVRELWGVEVLPPPSWNVARRHHYQLFYPCSTKPIFTFNVGLNYLKVSIDRKPQYLTLYQQFGCCLQSLLLLPSIMYQHSASCSHRWKVWIS